MQADGQNPPTPYSLGGLLSTARIREHEGLACVHALKFKPQTQTSSYSLLLSY